MVGEAPCFFNLQLYVYNLMVVYLLFIDLFNLFVYSFLYPFIS